MVYGLPAASRMKFVALKINNINQMVDFYTKVVGLRLIKRTENEAYLGISQKKIFLSFRKINHPSKNKRVANMLSFSLILPDKRSLKAILVHISNLGIKVSKIESSAYFDLFSLVDPEGNKVVLGTSNFSSTGGLRFASETRRISPNRYLNGVKTKIGQLPNLTRFGWVEMSVANLKRSVDFYHHQLGFGDQVSPDATEAILTTGSHRQQFILKQVPSLNKRNENTLGLDYFDIKMLQPAEIATLAKHLRNNKVNCTYSQPNNFIFISDPDRINIIFSLL